MRGITYLLLGGFFAGTLGVWIKLLGPDVSPFLLSVLRMFSVALLTLFLIFFMRKVRTLDLTKRELILFTVSGFFGVTLSVFFYVNAMVLAPVSNVVLILYFYPVFASILSWIFLKEKTKRIEIIAIIIAITGIWIIYGFEFSGGCMLGNMLALLTGLFYASFMVTTRYFENRGEEYWKVVFWMFLIGGLIGLLWLPFEKTVFIASGPMPFFLAGVMVCTFLMYLFYSMGLKTVRAHNAPIILLLTEPTTAIVLAWIVLSEVVTFHVLIGGALLITASLLVEKEVRKKKIRRRKEAEAGR
ncbi:MAG: DMT family transporter [Candidatus Aenigmarchaeota archaeon]|nr:DMT family transporter [Candidatus Aenigmarchaeota archaeon]